MPFATLIGAFLAAAICVTAFTPVRLEELRHPSRVLSASGAFLEAPGA